MPMRSIRARAGRGSSSFLATAARWGVWQGGASSAPSGQPGRDQPRTGSRASRARRRAESSAESSPTRRRRISGL